MRAVPYRTCRGFTLLEVLIVVTIIGALSFISLPSLLNAMDRSRQGSTVADMRAIATALERYALDHRRYPAAEKLSTLRPALQPSYIKELPTADGWSHHFDYQTDVAGSTYTLRSPGKDGEYQTADLTETTHDFAADIVCEDSVFVQRPEGEQEQAPPGSEPAAD